MMDPASLHKGQTYRSRVGGWDYFVLRLSPTEVDYRVETGPDAGKVCQTNPRDFCQRVSVRVPNHPPVSERV